MAWRLLADLGEEDTQRLIAIGRRRRFARGEVVFHQNDPADSLHLVTVGRFCVRVSTRLGDIATLAIVGRGDAFGEIALVGDDAVRSATVAALERAETLSIYHRDFDRLRRESAAIDQALTRLLAGQIRRMNQLLVDALFTPADARVLLRLAELASVYAEGEDATGPVTIPLTQETVSELAGTSRATVNRTLREQERLGAVRLRRGGITILSADALTSSVQLRR